jgi:acyl carrier protein
MINAYDEIAKLSPEERTLLEQLMKEEGVDISHLPISRVSREIDLPLSFSQERLWYLWNLAPENPSENVFVSFEIKGKLNIEALENAANEIVKRNEIFRTACILKDGEVYQRIHSEFLIKIEHYDFAQLEEEKKNEIKKIIEKEISRPFDLTKLPIFRLLLSKLSVEHHILTVLTHQFVSDGYTANLLLQTISEYYNILSNHLNVVNIQKEFDYVDFAMWQRKKIEGEYGRKQFEYWREKIKTMPTQLRFPTFNRTFNETGIASSFSFELSAEVSDKMRSFAEKEGFSLFMILLSGLQLTLHKMTRQDKVVVTTSVSTRGTSETENMFGNFSNNLLFCADFFQNANLKEILNQTRIEVGNAFENQELPLEHLVSVLQRENSSFIIPKIQVVFMLRDKNSDDLLKLDNLELTKFNVDFQFSKLDLLCDIFTANKKIRINITYKIDLFSQEIISEFSRIMGEVLSNFVIKPANKILDLPEFSTTGKYLQNAYSESKNSVEYVAPRNEIEKNLTEIWQKVLRVKSISINDNFFDLGGHSLLVVQLFKQIEEKINVELSIALIFECPTINQLASKILELIENRK